MAAVIVDPSIVIKSRKLQDMIASWVAERGYHGRSTSHLLCRKALGPDRGIGLHIRRIKMHREVEWTPVLFYFDHDLWEIREIEDRVLGLAKPGNTQLFGHTVEGVMNIWPDKMKHITASTNIDAEFVYFQTVFELASNYYYDHVKSRDVLLKSILDKEVLKRIYLTYVGSPWLHIALLINLKYDRSDIINALERYEQTLTVETLSIQFSRYKDVIIRNYLS